MESFILKRHSKTPTYAILVKSRMHTLYCKLSQPDLPAAIKMRLTKKFMDQVDSYFYDEREHDDKSLIESVYDKLYATDIYVCLESFSFALSSLKSAIEDLEHRIIGSMLIKKRMVSQVSNHNIADMLGTLADLDNASRLTITSFL